jgi:hypothetical protein
MKTSLRSFRFLLLSTLFIAISLVFFSFHQPSFASSKKTSVDSIAHFFQGVIKYKLYITSIETKKTDTSRIDVYFGANKIKFYHPNANMNDIYDLKACKLSTLYIPLKAYETSQMNKDSSWGINNIILGTHDENIAGYPTQIVKFKNSPGFLLGAYFIDNPILNITNDFYFHVPAEYESNLSIPLLVLNDQIALKLKSHTSTILSSDCLLELRAEEIIPKSVPDSEFQIPKGYKPVFKEQGREWDN